MLCAKVGEEPPIEQSIVSYIKTHIFYITRGTLKRKARYQSRKILLSAVCLPASFGIANEAEQRLTVGLI